MLFVARVYDFLALLLLQNVLGTTLLYIPALDIIVRRDQDVLDLHYLIRSKRRGE